MVRKRLLIISMAFLFICQFIGPGQSTFAKGADGFELSVAQTGDEIKVTVTLNGAKNLYAYDLVLAYDPLRLSFLNASISFPGLTVKPVLARGQIRLAHTSVGETAGRSGKIELARIAFGRLRGGDASVELKQAKLVDAKLAMKAFAPEAGITLESGQAERRPGDLAGHWSEDVVLEALELGFATGFGDGTFRPEEPVTRQEVTVLLAKAMLIEANESQGITFRDSGDIPPWALDYVRASVRERWINGYGDGTFRGGEPIARQELATVIARALDFSAIGDEAALAGFADRQLLASWAIGPTALAVERGIMQGQANRLLNPLATTTRAEAVSMILRMLYAMDS
ncbi:S-layer homology domain-containing protein [Paenibacillus sp. LHD-117]|uniref:S-layer homology domain-containing protein n=1 Tax=Paenibacillus sp. LHD-117 TaxID=3071412 RepID=UPI0027DEAF3B|nr:S-layer homology domain-containing protein [Paenibacillus sp. LHD-117]MDQ6419886.1 S-layer homology domain-containing protein [Paenibacillus sp. LHD-117]